MIVLGFMYMLWPKFIDQYPSMDASIGVEMVSLMSKER
jgi:hypothetical protein